MQKWQNTLGTNMAAGKVAIVAQLQPAGVHSVINAGFGLIWEQLKEGVALKDGAPDPQSPLTQYWTTDGPIAPNFTTQPDSNDRIYTIDGPNVGPFHGAVNTYDKDVDFWDDLNWNGLAASDVALWHWHGVWNNNAITTADLGSP